MGVSTSRAAKQLGCTSRRLWLLIERGEIPPPSRLNGVTYAWYEADIERARVALANRANAERARKDGAA